MGRNRNRFGPYYNKPINKLASEGFVYEDHYTPIPNPETDHDIVSRVVYKAFESQMSPHSHYHPCIESTGNNTIQYKGKIGKAARRCKESVEAQKLHKDLCLKEFVTLAKEISVNKIWLSGYCLDIIDSNLQYIIKCGKFTEELYKVLTEVIGIFDLNSIRFDSQSIEKIISIKTFINKTRST